MLLLVVMSNEVEVKIQISTHLILNLLQGMLVIAMINISLAQQKTYRKK